MNPVGASILAILVVVVFSAPRRWALLGMMAGVLYLTQGQQVSVLGFNCYAVRFLELAAFVRVMVRREFSITALNGIDRAVLLLYGYATTVFLLRAGENPANMIGVGLDACLCYFAFRGLVGGMEDFRSFLRSFAYLLVPFVLAVVMERLTHHNPFAFMGGVSEGAWLRDDKVRCQGSFRHPSLMGALAASFLPLYIGLAFGRADRRLAGIGAGLCLVIVWASNSGGPASAVAAALAAWLFWKFRTKMRLVRWGMLGGIGLAAAVMKAPVWYLIARLSSVTGGDGWHRAYLFDVSFQHFGQWWFAGLPLSETSDWFPYMLASGSGDITNQFINFGLSAGVGAIALFFLLLARSFKSLGNALATVRSIGPEYRDTEYLLWGMGAMLTTHIANWVGICYWDQIYVVWFMQLAAIANITEACSEPVQVESGGPVREHPNTLVPGIPQPDVEFARSGFRDAGLAD